MPTKNGMYTAFEIRHMRQKRAKECAEHAEICWTCICGHTTKTSNTLKSLHCKCGQWMIWDYPTGVH